MSIFYRQLTFTSLRPLRREYALENEINLKVYCSQWILLTLLLTSYEMPLWYDRRKVDTKQICFKISKIMRYRLPYQGTPRKNVGRQLVKFLTIYSATEWIKLIHCYFHRNDKCIMVKKMRKCNGTNWVYLKQNPIGIHILMSKTMNKKLHFKEKNFSLENK